MSHLKYALKRILFIIVGSLLVAIATNAIMIPNHLLNGGVTGIATFSYFLFGWNVSLLVFILNVPLFIIGFLFLKKDFLYYSLFGMIMFSTWLEITRNVTFQTTDTLSIIIVAGLLMGLGSGIVFRGEGSMGGSDIIAKIINNYFSLSMSTVNLMINAIIISFSIFFFGIDISILTLSTMFVSSKVTHFVVDGLNYKRTLFIITNEEHYACISDHIMSELHRGVTIIPAQGAYTHADRYVLYTTVGMREVAKARRIVSIHDRNAFMTVTPTSQVIGNGRGFISSDVNGA